MRANVRECGGEGGSGERPAPACGAYTRRCDRLAETEGRARRGRTAARANFGSCTAQGRRAGLGLVVVAENVVALRAAAEGGQVQAVLALVELGLGGLQVGAGRPEAPREAVVVGGVGDQSAVEAEPAPGHVAGVRAGDVVRLAEAGVGDGRRARGRARRHVGAEPGFGGSLPK